MDKPTRVQIPYKPRKWAVPMHASFLRWFAVVMHRRGGKTTAWLNHHQRAATDDRWEAARLRFLEPKFTDANIQELLRERIYAHVLPTLVQARSVAWEPLKFISAPVPGIKVNEQQMSITYPGPKGAHRVVRLFGADNIDALRGFPLSGLSLDEFSQHPAGIFGEVLSKSLADHLGYAAFLGTIKGKNQLYRTYEAAKDNPEWFSLWQDIDASLANEEGGTIIALRRAMEDDLKLIDQGLMTREEFEQEWYLSTEAAIKGAYYLKQIAEARRTERIKPFSHDPALMVHDVWDLGTGTRIGVGLYQAAGRERRMIGYVEGSEGDGMPQMIARLKALGAERGYVWGKHFAPHDIRATDQSTGKTRLETAASLGWKFEVVPMLSVDDGIEAGRLFFARLLINEKECQFWLDAIGQYRQEWDGNRGMFKEKPLHDWTSHPADVHRYAAVVEDQMTNDEPAAYQPPPRPAQSRYEGAEIIKPKSPFGGIDVGRL